MKRYQFQTGSVETICPDCKEGGIVISLEFEGPPVREKVYRLPGDEFPMLEIVANVHPVISKCHKCSTRFRERVIVERWNEEKLSWVL